VSEFSLTDGSTAVLSQNGNTKDPSTTLMAGASLPQYKKTIDSLYALQHRFVGLPSDALLHLTRLRIVATLQRLYRGEAESLRDQQDSLQSGCAELLARFETAAGLVKVNLGVCREMGRERVSE
jgi:hypothetical protein